MDGACRDSLEIDEMDYPVFSVGTNPNGPTKNIGGRIGHPVSIGGVTVHPGDLVIGDADGVTVIEREKAPFMLDLAAKKVADEQARISALKQGKDLRPAWVTKSLVANGMLKEGEKL